MPCAKTSLFALTLLTLVAVGHAQFSQEYEQELEDTVVSLAPLDGDGQFEMEELSSGVLISSEGYVLTTYDAVRGFHEDTRPFSAFSVARLARIANPATNRGVLGLVAYNPELNVAVLKYHQDLLPSGDFEPFPNSVDFPAVAVASTDVTPPQPDQIVYAVGWNSLAPTVTPGIVGRRNERGHIPWEANAPGKMERALSGSAVVDDAGRLVGIMSWSDKPALGGTPEDPQVEIIPISHAWDLLRDDAPGVIFARTESDGNDWSGDRDQVFGKIPLNQIYKRQIGSRLAAEDWSPYHSYFVEVPEGVTRLTIDVDGNGHELAMFVNVGGPLESYEGSDYAGYEDGQSQHTYVVDNPTSGPVYIELMNRSAFDDGTYELSVRAEGLPATDEDSGGLPGDFNLP